MDQKKIEVKFFVETSTYNLDCDMTDGSKWSHNPNTDEWKKLSPSLEELTASFQKHLDSIKIQPPVVDEPIDPVKPV